MESIYIKRYVTRCESIPAAICFSMVSQAPRKRNYFERYGNFFDDNFDKVIYGVIGGGFVLGAAFILTNLDYFERGSFIVNAMGIFAMSMFFLFCLVVTLPFWSPPFISSLFLYFLYRILKK